ncbi:glucose-1-phosphate thymidylyltransferase [Sediminibacterium roseum]|uniref:Glucose-1-phosphate thymidylyltransferase n=1 Tax=Sediminibacterium roseum TaxID=1978412 RepID=A0ABW9ZW17_9BACT|nr:putative sugar nucleotidyl transferase [Sediminibacterium roseum]NCI50233.1 glucose-1-phosphate thymidylyltransferase [Sediminibacterium roseum]
MAIVLFDNKERDNLFPLTYTRAVAGLRFGILTIKERWERVSGQAVFVHTTDDLQALYSHFPEEEHLWIDAAVVADGPLVKQVLELTGESCIADGNGLIAARTKVAHGAFDPSPGSYQKTIQAADQKRIRYPWQLMQWNDEMIRNDFALVTKGRTSQPIPPTVNVLHAENIFIEEGARLQFCTLNASAGPIYIGKNAEVMEGSAIRGPFSMGENSVLKLNSRVYGATTLGPSCMGGGEIKNSVMMGYSNKAHDGYLGDSVVGEWCNFGAGSSNSNLKNTAGDVKVWSHHQKQYLSAGQKCGVVMGDYSRAAINSSINTGTVIGVASNVFGAGLLPTIVANFRWGVTGTEYEFDKALNDINNWKKLKGHSLSAAETSVLKSIFAANT